MQLQIDGQGVPLPGVGVGDLRALPHAAATAHPVAAQLRVVIAAVPQALGGDLKIPLHPLLKKLLGEEPAAPLPQLWVCVVLQLVFLVLIEGGG